MKPVLIKKKPLNLQIIFLAVTCTVMIPEKFRYSIFIIRNKYTSFCIKIKRLNCLTLTYQVVEIL